MKTKLKFLSLALACTLMASACGKKDAEALIEIPLPGDSSQIVDVPQQERTYEGAYNLLDNTAPSRTVCEMILRDNIDLRSARAKAVRGQTQRIQEICSKAPAYQGDTTVKFGCREVSGGDFVPQASASTPFRCN